MTADIEQAWMAEDFERGQRLEQQLQTLVEQHATSQLNKTTRQRQLARAFLLHDADAAFRDGPRLSRRSSR